MTVFQRTNKLRLNLRGESEDTSYWVIGCFTISTWPIWAFISRIHQEVVNFRWQSLFRWCRKVENLYLCNRSRTDQFSLAILLKFRWQFTNLDSFPWFQCFTEMKFTAVAKKYPITISIWQWNCPEEEQDFSPVADSLFSGDLSESFLLAFPLSFEVCVWIQP